MLSFIFYSRWNKSLLLPDTCAHWYRGQCSLLLGKLYLHCQRGTIRFSTSNDHLFSCPIIYTQTTHNAIFVHRHMNNA